MGFSIDKLKLSRWLLTILQAFNGLSALLGGFLLLRDPSGIQLGLEPAWLEGTPFADYLIPGLVLFVVNGLGNLLGVGLTLRGARRAGAYGALFGLIMMVWILAQVMWIGQQSFLQPLYFGAGMLQFGIGYWHMVRTKVGRGEL